MLLKEEIDNRNTKRKSSIKNIIFSLKNVFVVEHIFGIYRFSIEGDQLLPSTWMNKIYCFMAIAFHIGMYIYLLPWWDLINGNALFVDIFEEIPRIVNLIQYIILVITTTIFYNKDHHDLFNTLTDLDSQLMITSAEFYKKAANKANKYLGFVVVTYSIAATVDLSFNDFCNVGELLFLPMYLIQKLEILLFCLIIWILRNRLDIINGYIKRFLEEKDEIISVFKLGEKGGMKTFNMIGRPSVSNMKIRDLAMTYNTIGSVCSMVNNIFNFQILISLLSTFCYIVITIWTTLYYYKSAENHSTALVSIIIWCVTTFLMVGIMCFICERLRSMRNTTKILVSQVIMDYSLPKTMRVQAKAFMELIEAWPLRIFIYDMFSADISLMLKFISVSTTYLIVIIQVSHFN